MAQGDVLTRVRYFGGMFLCTSDYQTEQAYHINARELLNSGIFTPGIVEGLTVNVDDDASPARVTVHPGRALDDSGRIIALADGMSLVLDQLTDRQTYSLIIRHNESNEDPPGDKATRIVERPLVELVPRPPLAGEILLTSLTVAKGKVSIDAAWGVNGKRQHAGAILGAIEFPLEAAWVPQLLLSPDPTQISIAARGYAKGDSPVLEVTSPYIALYGNVSASGGSLTVDGNLTVTGTAEVKGALTADDGLDVTKGLTTDTLSVAGASTLHGDTTIGGSLSFDGGLKVNQDLEIGGKLKADGGLDVTAGGLDVTGGTTTDTLSVSGTGEGDALTVTGDSSLTGNVNVDGTVAATKFVGNGRGLTDLPSSVWKQSGNKIYYNDGSVGIGDSDPSSMLTVRGGTGNRIASGLVTLGDATAGEYTLNGYQTSFSEEIGDSNQTYILTFGSIQEQEVEIVSCSDKGLTLADHFALSVGWSDFKFRHADGQVQKPGGRFLAEGVDVTGEGADFSLVAPGDMLIISSFISHSSDQWQVVKVTDNTTATIKNVSSSGAGSAPPNGSAFSIATSQYAVSVTGGAEVDRLTVDSTVEVKGAWMADSTVEVKGALTADSTVEVKGALTADSTVEVKGALTADGTVEVKGALTADTTVEVKGALTADTTVEVKGALTAGSTVEVKGALTADGTVEVKGTLTADENLEVTGILTVDGGSNLSGTVQCFGTVIQNTLTSTKHAGKMIDATVAATDGFLLAYVNAVGGSDTTDHGVILVVNAGGTSYVERAWFEYTSTATIPVPKGSTFYAWTDFSNGQSSYFIKVQFTWIPMGSASQSINWVT